MVRIEIEGARLTIVWDYGETERVWLLGDYVVIWHDDDYDDSLEGHDQWKESVGAFAYGSVHATLHHEGTPKVDRRKYGEAVAAFLRSTHPEEADAVLQETARV